MARGYTFGEEECIHVGGLVHPALRSLLKCILSAKRLTSMPNQLYRPYWMRADEAWSAHYTFVSVSA